MIASDADDSMTMHDVPILLLYRGSQQLESMVSFTQEVDGEFTQERIHKVLLQHLSIHQM